MKNATETDVDCGGTCPASCANGKKCAASGDCTSKVCTGSICQVPACNDTVKNGTETDVDCGGSCAPAKKCSDGLKCTVAGDCTSNICTGGFCVSPLPAECTLGGANGHTVIDEPNRSINNAAGPILCDSGLVTGWYRFMGAGGTKMPNAQVPELRCGTHAPGWVNGANPVAVGASTSPPICFAWGGQACLWTDPVTITNCGGYLVYNLQKPSVGCSLRYCTE